jgi:PEGA domain
MKTNKPLFLLRSILRIATSTTLSCAVAITAGCSAFQPSTQNVTVSTTTPGALIKANGVTKGQSPITFAAKRDQDLNLIAVKPGYQDSVLQIPRQTSGTFMLDAVGGFIWLIPWIGLLTPGAYQLSQTQVELPLNKNK